MSGIQGKVGSLPIEWKSIPRGGTGEARVAVSGREIEVRWIRDDDGLWLETPSGVFGYDIATEASDEGRKTLRLVERRGDRQWSGLAFLRAGEEQTAAAAGGKKKGLRVRAQMPGKIVRVLVKAGDAVAKDQPLLVMEAMKMENEIRAAQDGKVAAVKVEQGQAVESGADLVTLE